MKSIALLFLTLTLAACGTMQTPQIVRVPVAECPAVVMPAKPTYLTESIPDSATAGEVMQAFAVDLEAAIGYSEDLEKRLKPYAQGVRDE